MPRSLILPAKYAKAAQARGHKVNHGKTAQLKEAIRPKGVSPGGWVDRLSSRENAIVLCRKCQPKFDHKRHHYYKDRKFPWVQGKCDGCGDWDNVSALYIHEKFLADSNGQLRTGQCWTPK